MRIADKTLSERFRERLVAFTDPVSPERFGRRVWIVVACVVLLLLLPTLFFPLGHDQAMFFLGGRMIADGAIHYRDIVDIKPPLIYHLYALAVLLFGPEQYGIRILDLILQLATALLLCKTIRRASGNDLWGAIAALLYPISYVALSFGSLAQTESYTGLLGVGVIYLMLFRRTKSGFLLAGVLIGLLLLLKLTLGIFLAVVLIGELILFRRKWWSAIGNIAVTTAGFMIPVVGAILYLLLFDALDDFAMMQSFTSRYSSVQWASPASALRNALEQIPQYLVDEYSLLLFAFTLVGVAASLMPFEREGHREIGRLLRLSVISLLLLLLTIAIEGKYAPYQFARIYGVGIILGSYGLVQFLRWISRHYLDRSPLDRRYLWLVLSVTPVVVLLLSPVTRYLHHSGAMFAYLREGERGIDRYYGGDKVSYSRGEMLDIGDYWRMHRASGDRIYVFSAHSGMFYHLLGEVPPHKVFHMAFVVASFAPSEWRESTAQFIVTTRPAWIALQTNDSIPEITGRSTTSAEGILELPGVAPVLKSEYREVFRTPHFILLHRGD